METSESKSDKGILTLVNSLMKDGMGLSSETIEKIMRVIRNQGELSEMKHHMRSLSGSAYKRFNQALELARKEKESDDEAKGKESEDETEVTESKLTFVQHLLNEIGTADQTVMMDVDPNEIRDPEKRREAMRKQRRMSNKSQKEREIRKQIKDLQDRLKALRGGVDTGEIQ